MAGIFGDVLKGFLGSDYLKDYRHASKTFRSAGYELAPRYKFLFHVYFNLNVAELPGLRSAFGATDQSKLSLLVKNITLPNYSIDVDTFNQYNRKRLVHSKINYEPVTVEFHDDHGDLARSLWFKYFQYYYKDPSQPYGTVEGNTALSNQAPGAKSDYNRRDIYDQQRAGNDWGYSAEDGGSGTKPSFFKDITIYGMSQHNFVSYTLINPQITSYRHDTYDYSEGGQPMANSMEIRYETVKYGAGAINGSTGSPIPGFAQAEHYDKEPSSLSRAGSNNSILGQGGLLDAGVGVVEDLASGDILGAAKKVGRVVQTVDRDGIKGAKKEVLGVVIREGIPAATKAVTNFPTPPRKAEYNSNLPDSALENYVAFPNGPKQDTTTNNRSTTLVNANTNSPVNTAGGPTPGVRGYSRSDLTETITNADGSVTTTTRQTVTYNGPVNSTAEINRNT